MGKDIYGIFTIEFDKLEVYAKELLSEAKKKSILIQGHRPSILLASAVYIAGLMKNMYVTQIKVAEHYGTTESAVRRNSRIIWEILNLETRLEERR